MAEKAVVFYASYYEAMKDLPADMKAGLFDAIMSYGLYGEVVDIPDVLRPFFTLIRPNIDASSRRYQASVINGAKGGRPSSKNQNETRIKPERNHDKETEKETEKDTDTETDTPGISEIKSYCLERGINPERFYSYYQEHGWPTDWKAKVRSWEANGIDKPKPVPEDDISDLLTLRRVAGT